MTPNGFSAAKQKKNTAPALFDMWCLSKNSCMTDLQRILLLWRELEAEGADYVLATVIAVEGPSYRKPGAAMLLGQDGRRAGTVSGGCLEAEVARRAWWHTGLGPSVQRYSTVEEDGDRPYGSGCGGVVWLLLERRPTAAPLLHALDHAYRKRVPIAVATILEGELAGKRAFAGLEAGPAPGRTLDPLLTEADSLQSLAERALASRGSAESRLPLQGAEVRIWTDFRPARPGLWIVGAGDDAQPLLQLGKALGWYLIVADGRSHLATRERFAAANEVHVLALSEMRSDLSAQSAGRPSALANLRPQDAVVLMTHSFEQDSRVLASLLAMEARPAYIGVLGPQRRTRELLAEAARLLVPRSDACSDPDASNIARVERWLGELHAPTGLDLGAESPETIALSIVAEIQKSFAGATALPLSEIRGVAPAVSR
jgi:xanthine/CO dehydrogenase XdhC/CoxF family maturation factor